MPFRGRQAAAESVADDRLHLLGPRRGIAQLPPALAGAAVADGDRPGVEQVAADRDLIVPVVVLLGVVGLEGDGQL